MIADPQDMDYLKTLTILYVEDDPQSREEIGTFIGRRARRLVSAANGEEGLAAYKAECPQLVVTDIQMPRMDGLAMAREIRQLDPAIPIIVTTAFELTGYLTRSIELGIDRYVVKPIQGEQLETALLACAHRLLAEDQLRLKRQLEAEAIQNRHHVAMHLLLEGLAHDYNNLLQSIFAGVDLASFHAESGSKVQKALNLTKTGSVEVRDLSRRLLQLVDASEGIAETGSLEPLLREVVQAALQGTLVTAEFDGHAEAASVKHNPGNIARVFRNLAENACEAMPSGGTLQISTEACQVAEGSHTNLLPGRYLRIRFRDNGPGIAAGDLPFIFEPYFSTKERGRQRGMGLGLALCAAIVRAHGGAITAESTPGQGAAFILHLPVEKPAATS